jgi:hypothetical protein
MAMTPRHEEVEERFRALLQSSDLPPPDDVGYEPDSVVFYWHDPKLAVCVDFDDPSDGVEPASAGGQPPGRTSPDS